MQKNPRLRQYPNRFDNAFLLTDKVLKASDAVNVTYYEMDLFDAKLGNCVSYKIVTDITKK